MRGSVRYSPRVPAAPHRSLLRIRRIEEEVARVHPTDVVKSPVRAWQPADRPELKARGFRGPI